MIGPGPGGENRGHDVQDLVGKRPSHWAEQPLAHVDRNASRTRVASARRRHRQHRRSANRDLHAVDKDTVLAKLEWFRLEAETSERQWWDVVGILKVTEDADRSYLRRWADSLGVADLLERALDDAAS